MASFDLADIEALRRALGAQNDDLRAGRVPVAPEVSSLAHVLEEGLARHRGLLPADLARPVRLLAREARENRIFLDAAKRGACPDRRPTAYGASGNAITSQAKGRHNRKF